LDFPPARGSGQTVYAEKIAKGLSKNHQVTMITSAIAGCCNREFIDNIDVRRIDCPSYDPSKWIAFGYQAAAYLRNLRKREWFDIVHFLDAHVAWAFDGPFAATLHQSFNQRLKGDNGLPYASSVWNFLKRYPYYLVARELEKKAVKKAAAFIAVSKATKKEFVMHYKTPASKVHVIYNGIDTDFFKPVDAASLRRDFQLDGKKILLYVGFTTPRKGIETLFQALNLVKTKNVKLLLVGKWEKGYKKVVDKKFKFMKYCVIEAGYVKDEEMPLYYSLADIFILPSLLEGFGFPLAEAMACKTPVISTNVGAIPEVVGSSGILIPPRNAVLLAGAIDRLLSEQTLRDQYKESARAYVLDNFSQDIMVQKTVDFYKSVAYL